METMEGPSNNEDDMNFEIVEETPSRSRVIIDCYPYTFTPLLLFSTDGYFDKGYSNYHSVAAFFQSVLPVDMLDNVLCDRKNMLYEELLSYIAEKQMLVTCCIDAHFTAFCVLGNCKKPCLLYYDPFSTSLKLATGDSFRWLALYFLLKCNYGDSQHIQDNKDYYTGVAANATRRAIYTLWKKIHQVDSIRQLGHVKLTSVSLNLNDYYLINDRRNHRNMSTQLTGNTCYFQTFLFAVLCKICQPSLSRDGKSVDFTNVNVLKETTINMSRFLLTFFVDTHAGIMRPLTNSNFVLDFFRHRDSPYYQLFTNHLRMEEVVDVPDYDEQFHQVLQYFEDTKCLHTYDKFSLDGAMTSTPNTKQLQAVYSTEDAMSKLAMQDYYKYRAANLMFGFNAEIIRKLEQFCEFNALRKNQLLAFYDQLENAFRGIAEALTTTSNKYRDYYFMPQFEIGQQQLVDIHHYLYLLDLLALGGIEKDLIARVHTVNELLIDHTLFSTSKSTNYDKIMSLKELKKTKQYRYFKNAFMTVDFFTKFIGLGFGEINPKEKEINSLTQTVFYAYDLMRAQANRQSYEFEKECINQMARSNNRPYMRRFEREQNYEQAYSVIIAIGRGFTYSKYNTLMHFLNVADNYWNNPDLSNIQVFGKDIRVLLAVSCQKIFFDKEHCGFYHYGPFKLPSSGYSREDLDLSVASSNGTVAPEVNSRKRDDRNRLVITDRVFEFHYLHRVLEGIFSRANGVRFKSDNEVLNLCMLSLMLDFGLYEQYVGLLNVPFLQSLQHEADTRELQVEVANLIYEFDRKNTTDSVTRGKVEELIFECSYKFLVNKDFSVQSEQFKLIQMLNADPDYQSYVLLCKIYMSLCQINKSVEVDYYKVHCDGEFRIIIPLNFSKRTSNYLDEVSRQYTFSEEGGIMVYDDLAVFDLRPNQPEINLHRIRFDSAEVQSMVKYIEISNAFQVLGSEKRHLVFMADNVLLVDAPGDEQMVIRINKIDVKVASVFFNQAISFIPCFKYAESEDVVLFTSRNIHYMVDKAGQFHSDYYGMKHELIECISSVEVFVDLNDEHVFRSFKLSELLTESKTVIHFPDYLLQVSSRQQLINLLDLAIHIRNVSFFILVLFYLRRSSVALEYIEREGDVVRISGPWKQAILYVLNRHDSRNPHYDSIFEQQFFDLNQYNNMALGDFIDVLCDNFTKYQRWTEDGEYEIVPRPKQKEFLKRIICSETPMHFSEVGTGKTKVIMPLLCQIFLSNNVEAHKRLARSGKAKNVLVILVPEHLVPDARAQVFRYCLNLNFREEYRIFDDIFALMHCNVELGSKKMIFVTSFNQFKKSLTYDSICSKVYPHREQILVIADEVDDFLDRNKLVFNICSNKSNAFDRSTLDFFFEASHAAYNGEACSEESFESSSNPEYWKQLVEKFKAIHAEIQDASKSINKSFGIFNEQTLRHCSTNIVHDIEGYKSLIARPYESVNRAMPGSYYSDVERTIFLTYVILTEDITKYDDLFQSERKFISFEYWSTHFIHHLDFDDLVYGHEKLSEVVAKHPETKDGLSRYLYEIILRRMEIRDKSRSVNSIDVVFNFDCVGFTGTPFLDNYPTFDYIRHERKDDIPDLIDRSFYAYTSDALSRDEFEERFTLFQGQNCYVHVEYVPSDFIRDSTDEMATLESIFSLEEVRAAEIGKSVDFNCLVDLCGIFKRSTIHDMRDLIKKHFGSTQFQYLYHIDPATNSDRVLCMNSDNDVQYDEEFYRYLCKTYGASLRDRIFFFVDNRNVIGKDIPFQLVYRRHFGQPLFTKSIVLAHDVDDFSKIWQAMGRSRTMNDTVFSIYKSSIPSTMMDIRPGVHDVKKQELTRSLYVHNCDCKMAGNISSIYLTLVALYNLSQKSFYFCDTIVNTFLDKMEKTILEKVLDHENQLARQVLGSAVPARILQHILIDKFRRSSNEVVAETEVTEDVVEKLLRQIVQQKFEQREPSNDVYDDFVTFLSGEQRSLMEISYTKQQQKQKQKQQNKNQDSDAMGIFDAENQLQLTFMTENYYEYSRSFDADLTKTALGLPSSIPILTVTYEVCDVEKEINVYPTLQFLYSHHIRGSYICDEVQAIYKKIRADSTEFYRRFLQAVDARTSESMVDVATSTRTSGQLDIRVLVNFIRQNPQYSIAALKEGVYVIGMKDQFNVYSLQNHPLHDRIQYVSDDMGFILFDKTANKSIDSFGPYFIEQYILLEVLSKHEVAQNVMDYYCNHKETLQRGLDSYDEIQGKGFICWRFLINETAKAMAAAKRDTPADDTQDEHDPSTPKRARAADADIVAKGLANALDI